MYEQFFLELEKSLTAHNIKNKDAIIQEYKEKFEAFKKGGKSEFECIMALGDAEEIACRLAGINITYTEKLTKNIVEISQIPINKSKKLSAKKANISEKTEDASYLNQNEKPPTKVSVYLTDCLYYAPSILVVACGLIALTFISLLCGALGFMYTFLSWTKFDTINIKLSAFALALIGIAMCAMFSYIVVKLAISTINGSKKYFMERKEKMAIISDGGK